MDRWGPNVGDKATVVCCVASACEALACEAGMSAEAVRNSRQQRPTTEQVHEENGQRPLWHRRVFDIDKCVKLASMINIIAVETK